MKDFIFVPGHAINPAAITHVKYNKDGSAHVTIGNDTLIFQGDDAKVFFDFAPKAEPKLVSRKEQAAADLQAAADAAKAAEAEKGKA